MKRTITLLFLFATCFLGLAVPNGIAANISVLDEKIQGFTVIVISGELNLGDDERFVNKALKIDKAVVFLSGPGGMARVGVEIGKTIRLKNYITAVPPEGECASACGLIWLGGAQRLVYEPGRVGFHAVYNVKDGATAESGAGNAIVGAYLSKLDLTEVAIEYLTESPPDEMTWLKPEFARVLGIEAEFIPSKDDALSRESSSPQTSIAAPPSAPPPEIKSPPNNARKDFVQLSDRDIYGFDIGKPLNVSAAVDCERSCAETASCAAYTFIDEWKRCYLKMHGDRVIWRKGATSGYLSQIANSLRFTKVAIHPSSNLEGQEIGYVLDSKTEDCITLCENNTKCTGFTFARKPEGRCSLKGGKLRLKPTKAMIAGVITAQ